MRAPEGLRDAIRSLFPASEIVGIEALLPDRAAGETEKAEGYGEPLEITLRDPQGAVRRIVFRTAAANEFGHDRRSDRADGMILAYDTFPLVPSHVAALDVGAIGHDGRLVSLRGTGEFYLVTGFAEGRLYAEDLRRIANDGKASGVDRSRCEALARYLVRLHAERIDDPAGYRRAIRDLVGHGEGIFGMVDGYPPAVPAAPAARLRSIEERCLAWRWLLRGRESRLARTHGDFHPFNVVFRETAEPRFTLLDASRGTKGDPADDVTCMAVNYVFFALERPGSWSALGPLWRRFWEVYLAGSGDDGVLEVAPPYLAWRGLVLASPRFYPHLSPRARDALLAFVERALDAPRFDPASAEVLFA